MGEGSRPLAGMTAVVTGGAGGIGRATSELLVRDGAHVVIAGRTESKLTTHAERLGPLAEASGGSIRWKAMDALDEAAVEALVAMTAEPTGRVDMACAIVGGAVGGAPVLRHTVQALEDTLRKNITSTYLLMRHAGAAMVRQGGGSIVAISSMQGHQSAPYFAAYCAGEATRWGGGEVTPFQASVPVVLSGVGVIPGQYVFADASGAVMIPAADLERALAAARSIKADHARDRE